MELADGLAARRHVNDVMHYLRTSNGEAACKAEVIKRITASCMPLTTR